MGGVENGRVQGMWVWQGWRWRGGVGRVCEGGGEFEAGGSLGLVVKRKGWGKPRVGCL